MTVSGFVQFLFSFCLGLECANRSSPFCLVSIYFSCMFCLVLEMFVGRCVSSTFGTRPGSFWVAMDSVGFPTP